MEDESNEDIFTSHKKGKSTLTIRLINSDENPDSAHLHLRKVADVFVEGVILFDNGKILVHLNPCTDFLNDFDKSAHEEQKDFLLIQDVYRCYKTILLYRNKKGNLVILPKNQYTQNIFYRLNGELKENITLPSELIVLLKDVYKPSNNSKQMTQTGQREYDEVVKEIPETNLTYRVSLKLSRKKIYFKNLKVIIPWIPSLPLTLTSDRKALLENLRYPIQVSEDQQDDECVRSKLVVSSCHPSITRDGNKISYGLRPKLGVNDESHSPATNHLWSDLRGSERQMQERPREQSRHPNYSDYPERFKSYTRWIYESPSPEILSQAGFFFTNQGDLVRCFQCGIGLKDFSADDDPLLEHVRHSRQCPFLPEHLGVDGMAMYQNRLQAVDPEYNRRQQWAERQSGSALRSSYYHPAYQSLQNRLASFLDWPKNMVQTPQQLAEAGLYYTGIEDQVRCFACDGGLRRWDPEDDPWTEHCRWFPSCLYVLEQKGEQYIAQVQMSVENEGYEAHGQDVYDLASGKGQLKYKESVIEANMAQHKAVYLDFGYREDDVKEAVQELLERGCIIIVYKMYNGLNPVSFIRENLKPGNEKPTLEDIISVISVIKERKLANEHKRANDSPLEDCKRKQRISICITCEKNTANTLFLPCIHHEMCIQCADSFDKCPVCHRAIREKIRTYMA